MEKIHQRIESATFFPIQWTSTYQINKWQRKRYEWNERVSSLHANK